MLDRTEDIIKVENLSKSFSVSAGLFAKPLQLRALQDINFTVKRGETLGIVGESGCGKSTLGRCILQLLAPDEGSVLWLGQEITRLPEAEMRKHRRDLQIIFQDPLASLNPRMTVGEIIADPLRTLMPEIDAKGRRERVLRTMEAVGLLPEMINRYPHEFSGGQAQRIGIARALISEPKLIVCDEPVSALDVSIQAQILNLLKRLQRDLGLTYVFISHDLGVVQYLCDQVAVMYLGRIVELAPAERLFAAPQHPYTWSLMAAASPPGRQRAILKQNFALQGEPPSPINPPPGCRFAARCPFAEDRCRHETPQLSVRQSKHFVACHRAEEVAALGDRLMTAA
jgi:oligopeptide transport system ATP-binding protein